MPAGGDTRVPLGSGRSVARAEPPPV